MADHPGELVLYCQQVPRRVKPWHHQAVILSPEANRALSFTPLRMTKSLLSHDFSANGLLPYNKYENFVMSCQGF
jgi:hypothetical protein